MFREGRGEECGDSRPRLSGGAKLRRSLSCAEFVEFYQDLNLAQDAIRDVLHPGEPGFARPDSRGRLSPHDLACCWFRSLPVNFLQVTAILAFSYS